MDDRLKPMLEGFPFHGDSTIGWQINLGRLDLFAAA